MAAKRTRKAQAKKNVKPKTGPSAGELRTLALLRRAHTEGQRLMRRKLAEWLEEALFLDDWSASDILEVVRGYALRDPPAWMQPPRARGAARD